MGLVSVKTDKLPPQFNFVFLSNFETHRFRRAPLSSMQTPSVQHTDHTFSAPKNRVLYWRVFGVEKTLFCVKLTGVLNLFVLKWRILGAEKEWPFSVELRGTRFRRYRNQLTLIDPKESIKTLPWSKLCSYDEYKNCLKTAIGRDLRRNFGSISLRLFTDNVPKMVTLWASISHCYS